MEYEVTYTITGKSFDPADNGKVLTITEHATIEFRYDPNTYGNGYHMGVRSKAEPFGFSGYDIRYDHDFDESELMTYIVHFYSRRYHGNGDTWKLIGIEVKESPAA